jgi:hydroxymethylbilane synthase
LVCFSRSTVERVVMSTREKTLRLATRGSALAIRQASEVQEALEDRRYDVELVEVETTGDQIRDELIHRLGKTGAFVRTLDERVVDGDCDVAVHSMKDVPTEFPADLVVAGVPARKAANDVLVTANGATLSDLPENATVGTSSLRRTAQLLAARPDLDVQPLRGNVDTRIEKLLAPVLQREHEQRTEAEKQRTAHAGADEEHHAGAGEGEDEHDHPYDQSVEEWFDGLAEVERRALERDVDTEYDAIVLAEVGLQRLGLLHHVAVQPLAETEFVPSTGQGALAVTAADEAVAQAVRDVVDDSKTRVEMTVERTILDELGGGCIAPIGIYAVLQGGVVRTTVRVLSRDGTDEVQATRELPVERHPEAAAAFAADLRERGAAALIDQARTEADDL